MSIVERDAQIEEWNGQERRRAELQKEPHTRRSAADFALLALATALVLAEFAWLSFLAYIAARLMF
jgi:hypothetical protein